MPQRNDSEQLWPMVYEGENEIAPDMGDMNAGGVLILVEFCLW